jgi:RimJ/RimL family protein N-acetyltransferase
MSYCRKVEVIFEDDREKAGAEREIPGRDALEKEDRGEGKRWLYITDDASEAKKLRNAGEAVVVWLHGGNRDQDFSEFIFALEDPEHLEQEYIEKVYRRLKGLPWKILETERCLVRETTVEDVDAFYEIYSEPAITEHMEDLYPKVEQEKQYVKEYIEKVYTYYEFGVWTVLLKETGEIIGRAGLSMREGYAEPELGFLIGVPWQRKGYAGEVCRGILDYGWERLGFDRVQVLVEPENAPSLHLCRKLGFAGEEVLELNGRKYCRMIKSFS